MIDLGRLREQPVEIAKLIKDKEPSFDIEKLISLDSEFRSLKQAVEHLRSEKNELAKQAKGGITDDIREKSIALGTELKQKEKKYTEVEQAFKSLWLSCPNITLPGLPIGGKEHNKPVKTIGEKPTFDFAFKNHLELNKTAQWFDLESAARMSGGQFVTYLGDGVKVIYALTRLMLQNNVKHGFNPIMTPVLAQRQALVNAGNLPKFADDAYQIPNEDLYVIPTSEVTLTNMHAGQILSQEELPKRYTCWSSCFRREAGGYGAQERGLIRIHQFEKVEVYTVCEPDKAQDEQERMLACAEDLLKQLGLHYQVSLLASQDCSFSSAKTYDIEVWLPGQDRYYEVSSVSNCTDFQARRSGIRFRESPASKPQLAYTLNGSSLALPRLMVALMENGQQADGSIVLPELLQKTMNELW